MVIGIVTPYYPDMQTTNSGLANHFSVLAQSLINIGNKVVIMHIRPAYENENDRFVQTDSDRLILLTYKVSLPTWFNKMLKNNWAALDFLIKLKCMLVAFKNINRVKKTYNLNVIETTSYYSLCYLYLFKRQEIPIIVRVSTTCLQMMDNYYSFKSRLLRVIGLLEIRMIIKSHFLITHAYDHAKELEKLYNIPAANFHIISHGVNLPPAKSLHLQENSSQVKILYVGRLEYRKGTDVLLEAIPHVLKTYPEAHFELIGSDPNKEYESGFRSQSTPEINACVTFMGNADDHVTKNAYADCDIFVAPSRYESFGLIYIEAMSYGKPAIGCNVGGVSEIIEHNKNGLFATVNDSLDLARQINLLIRNQKLRKEMGVNARKTIEDKFTKEKLAENSLHYYKKAIKFFESN